MFFAQKGKRPAPGAITALLPVILSLLISSLWVRSPEAVKGSSPQISWPNISFNRITEGLSIPVYVTHAGDSSQRLFIVEQAGVIRIFKNGSLAPMPFLDIRDRVRAPGSGGGSEEGLLSIAFPPGYANKGRFYVYYTDKDGNNVVSRFSLSNQPNIANPASETQILLLLHPVNNNHNGGQMAFGPDGYLYIGTGDGGGGGDPNQNAQNLGSMLGKILRIDVETGLATPGNGPMRVYLPLVAQNNQSNPHSTSYLIPSGNPFVDIPGARGEIWSLGLRNPWRFSFDPQSGDLYIGDVGQSGYEEVNFQPATSSGGDNYGWNIMEGFNCYNSVDCNQTGLILPVIVYPTHSGGACAITGGYVYRGTAYPSMAGIYVYGDYCNGKVWGLQKTGTDWQTNELADTTYFISSFGEDEVGNIYLVDRSGGAIYRIEAVP